MDHVPMCSLIWHHHTQMDHDGLRNIKPDFRNNQEFSSYTRRRLISPTPDLSKISNRSYDLKFLKLWPRLSPHNYSRCRPHLTCSQRRGINLKFAQCCKLLIVLQFESKSSRAKGIAFHPKR